MSQESSQSKTEQPTAKRLRDLRKRGQVPRSKDLTPTAVLVMCVAYFYFAGAHMVDQLKGVLYRVTTADYKALVSSSDIMNWTADLFFQSILIPMPLILALFVVSVLISYMQVGAVFSIEGIMPQLDRVNPIEGAKRLFSMENVIELIKLILKTAILGVVVYVIVVSMLPTLLRAPWLLLGGILPLASKALGILSWSALGCFIAIAAFDFWFQKWNFIRRNKMSMEEVRREYKEMEGDPHVRGRRRQLHHEINVSNMMDNVRKANVVVVNPTHVAIALYYEDGKTDLPLVVAKGEGHIAQQIRKIAEEEGIPVLRNVDLARRLLERVPVDQYIPDEFIEPVAAVLRWARGLRQGEEKK